MQSHSHEYHQLVLPLHGTIDIDIEGNRASIGPKNCALIYKGKKHCFFAHENAKFLVADLNKLPDNMLNCHDDFVAISDTLQMYIHFIEKQLEHAFLPTIEKSINELFINLLSAQTFLPHVDARIKQVIEYLNQQLHTNIRLDELAKTACLSLSQYKVLFKQSTGKTTRQYLLSLRMDKARALLSYTDDPVTIVADKVGYQDLSAFSRRFSNYFGQAPSFFKSS